MTLSFSSLLMIISLICFLLAAFWANLPPRINPLALGLAFFVAAQLAVLWS